MKRLFLFTLCLLAAACLAAAEDAPTILALSTDADTFKPATDKDEAPLLHLYPIANADAPVPAVLICPGGGYGGLAMDYEGIEVAQWLNRNGVAGFVLQYRVAPHRHPKPLHDAQRAMRIIRAHAEEWRVDPNKVGVLGFSAGGHLASTLSTLLERAEDGEGEGEGDSNAPVFPSRPDFSILIYPVISIQPPYGHIGSGNNLLGPDAERGLFAALCTENRVSDQTPPAFLVHSTADKVVSAENSLAYYLALLQRGIPAEMHIYEQGDHGYGMGKGDPILSTWTDHCIAWLRTRAILTTP